MQDDAWQKQIEEQSQRAAWIACDQEGERLNVVMQPLLKEDRQGEDDEEKEDGHFGLQFAGDWQAAGNRQTDMRVCYFAAARQTVAKSDATKLAPPTSAPSISGWTKNSTTFFGVTLPPYCTRID